MTPPGDLPNPGIEPRSPVLQADSLPNEPPVKPPKLLKNLNEVELGDQKGELSCPATIAEPNRKKTGHFPNKDSVNKKPQTLL